MGIVGLIGGKKGKLCVRFIVAAAILAAVVLAYAAFAAALFITNRTFYQPQNRSTVMPL